MRVTLILTPAQYAAMLELADTCTRTMTGPGQGFDEAAYAAGIEAILGRGTVALLRDQTIQIAVAPDTR